MGRNSAFVAGEIESDIFTTLLTFPQTAVSEQEQMEVLLAKIEKVTRSVRRYKQYEILHLDSLQVEETEDTARSAFVDLKATLVKIYTVILEVLANACNTFGQSGIKRCLSSTFNPGLYVGLANQLSSLDDDVIKCAGICENVYNRNRHKNDRRTRILQWISSISYEDKHNTACEGHTGWTGEWLLEHQTYDNWKSSGENTILWLHGIREKPIPNFHRIVY